MTAQNPILQGTAVGQIAGPHRSWLGRNWKWLRVAFLGLVIFVAGIFTLIMGGMRSSDVAKELTPTPVPETSAPAAATPQASPSSAGLGSGDGEQDGTKVVITDLKRGGSTVTLKFTIYNDSNTELNTGMRFKADGYKENGGRSFSGIHLIDSVSKKKYFVAADSDGNCLCSEHVDDVKSKTKVSLWAKFPAPPDNVQRITVEIPHFIPIEDVPIK